MKLALVSDGQEDWSNGAVDSAVFIALASPTDGSTSRIPSIVSRPKSSVHWFLRGRSCARL